MNILFKSNVFDENGKYHGDDYFGLTGIELLDPGDNQIPFGIHVWDKWEELSFDGIIRRIEFLCKSSALEMMNPIKIEERLGAEKILKQLQYMLDHKLITARLV